MRSGLAQDTTAIIISTKTLDPVHDLSHFLVFAFSINGVIIIC